MKRPLYALIDSKQYVDTNCYQHQLSEALEARFDVRYVTMGNLDMSQVPASATVLSRLKLRTLRNNLGTLKEALNARPVLVYDQDPWESFKINDVYSGAYRAIHDTLNVRSFLNISHWWRDRVRDLGMPSEFVQVWTLPRYCRAAAIPWAQRKHDAVFCGTMYPHRQRFFDGLGSLGVKVEVLPAGRSFPDYLEAIAHAKLAIRTERIDWTLERFGRIELPNALWKRDIETAAQGCFSMREWDQEAIPWRIDTIPSIATFTSLEDAAQQVSKVLSMDPDRADELASEGIDRVRSAQGWNQACDVVEGMIVP